MNLPYRQATRLKVLSVHFGPRELVRTPHVALSVRAVRCCSSVVERVLGKDEVMGPTPISSLYLMWVGPRASRARRRGPGSFWRMKRFEQPKTEEAIGIAARGRVIVSGAVAESLKEYQSRGA